MEKPIVIYHKRADIEKNRIIIPKAVIENWGRYFTLELYDGYLKLVPVKKGE